jgi:hypothetical protein
MKTLGNEKGFALVFVLVLAAITLAMTLAMLFMSGRGSYVSGQQKRYRTAGEASRGGMEAMLQVISDRGIQITPFPNQVITTALTNKLAWPTTSWAGLDNTLTINPSDNTSYDMRVDLGVYRVYTKIADTVEGNSGSDEGLEKFGTGSGSGEVTVVSVPYLYTIEVLAQAATNPTDRSRISVLYQY